MITEYENTGPGLAITHFRNGKIFRPPWISQQIFDQSPGLHNPFSHNLLASRRFGPLPIHPSSGSWDFNLEPIRQAQGRL